MTNKHMELIGDEFDIIVKSQAVPATAGVTPEAKLTQVYDNN